MPYMVLSPAASLALLCFIFALGLGCGVLLGQRFR